MGKKRFLVPPDLGQKLLIFGMTLNECVIVVLLFFLFIYELTLLRPLFLVLPAGSVILFARVSGSNENALSVLMKRMSFYLFTKSYSIKEINNV